MLPFTWPNKDLFKHTLQEVLILGRDSPKLKLCYLEQGSVVLWSNASWVKSGGLGFKSWWRWIFPIPPRKNLIVYIHTFWIVERALMQYDEMKHVCSEKIMLGPLNHIEVKGLKIRKVTLSGNGQAERSPDGGTWESSLNVNKAAGQGQMERKKLLYHFNIRPAHNKA